MLTGSGIKATEVASRYVPAPGRFSPDAA
jgi:hypothetical protein